MIYPKNLTELSSADVSRQPTAYPEEYASVLGEAALMFAGETWLVNEVTQGPKTKDWSDTEGSGWWKLGKVLLT